MKVVIICYYNVIMKLIIAGVGPGTPGLITLEALNEARRSDLILVPSLGAGKNRRGIAEKIILAHVPEARVVRVNFPMIQDSDRRNGIILLQLNNIKADLKTSQQIFFPVIGDSLLFSTGAYLAEAFRKIFPDVTVNIIPGISVHSLAASYAQKFLAMSDEILSIVPGNASPEKIYDIMRTSNAIAIYKPNLLKNLRELVEATGPYEKIFRVDHAGIPGKERVIDGLQALKRLKEYMSIIILWKDSQERSK